MSELTYRLDLTEVDIERFLGAVDVLLSMVAPGCAIEAWCRDMDDKLRALEPIGTGGTTEGA